MPNFRNLLPNHFPVKTPVSKSPAELYDFLSDLLNRQKQVSPDNDYLQVHSNPRSISNHVYTLTWYLPYLPETGKVLDWGCNYAPDSCMIRALFGDQLELHGCDFGEPGAQRVFHDAAKLQYKQIPDHIHVPYEDNTFDVVVASGALEHAVFDYKSLEELYRVLKPEGKLIVSYLPNRYSYYEWIKEHISKKDFHPRRYGLTQTKDLMKHNGFLPVSAGAHIFFWEQKLALVGLKTPKPGLIKLLSFIFPIHLVAGCYKLVAIKKSSM